MTFLTSLPRLHSTRRNILSAAASAISRRHISEHAESRIPWQDCKHPDNKFQIWTSTTRDPFINLSVEHYLLNATPDHSTILILYTNSPCVVIGRNQNPWTEVNLPRLAQIRDDPESVGWTDGPVELVRRRSGGGAVFHDEGNINYCVICPAHKFDRNTHAYMITSAIRSLGLYGSRVTPRHDIWLDVPGNETYKISGSAYKITRTRALHHGTCLLQSPNLESISGLLRSPAEPFIQGFGVDSVRSPVRNVGLEKEAFKEAVIKEFQSLYGFSSLASYDDQALRMHPIRVGCAQLRDRDWIYGQTPRFTFSNFQYIADRRERPELPMDIKLFFQAKQGKLETLTAERERRKRPGKRDMRFPARKPIAEIDMSAFDDTPIYDISSWGTQLSQAGLSDGDAATAGSWLDSILGTEFTKP
ncbi:hypothetical protein ACJ41O_014140 [Fusarium nematophilum]